VALVQAGQRVRRGPSSARLWSACGRKKQHKASRCSLVVHSGGLGSPSLYTVVASAVSVGQGAMCQISAACAWTERTAIALLSTSYSSTCSCACCKTCQCAPLQRGNSTKCERKGRALTGRAEPPSAAWPRRTRARLRAGQVGEGAALAEGELVMPLRPHMGTWRSLAVWRARDLLRLPPDALPSRGPAVLPASACGPHACGAIGSNGPNVYLYMSSECFSAPRNGRSKACFSQLGLLRQRVCQASKHSWHSCHMLVTYV